MRKIKPNSKFKAVFNPYTLELSVKYGNSVINHQFSEHDEWAEISFNNDISHPNYLHVHCDYDEELQLIFYPRVENSESLNERLTKSWCSEISHNSRNIKIAKGSNDFERLVQSYLID